MRVLLDESIPHQLRAALAPHDAQTVTYAGLTGYENDALWKAENAWFDVPLTADKDFEYRTKPDWLALVCMVANSLRRINPRVAQLVFAIDSATPNSFTMVASARLAAERSGKARSPASQVARRDFQNK